MLERMRSSLAGSAAPVYIKVNGQTAYTAPKKRGRRRVRHHIRDGQCAAAVRAFTAARIYLARMISTLGAAAEGCGTTVTYVQAAIIVIQSKDEKLHWRVLKGRMPLLQAAKQVAGRVKLVDAFLCASAEDRIAAIKTIGPEFVFDNTVVPALSEQAVPAI